MIDRLLVTVLALVAALAVGCTGTSDPDAGVPESIAARDLTLAVGQSETAIVSTHCGYERLELEINGAFWATETLGADSAGNPTEPSWPQGTQSAELRLELIDPTTLSVRALGSDVSHEYHPVETEPWCE
jgi:hypothetical protein